MSSGKRLRGIWRFDPHKRRKRGVIIQGPGWLGLKDASMYEPYHIALTHGGFSVLIFDYTGFGESEGGPEDISLQQQLVDLQNAVLYICSRDDVLPDSIGVFGSGATGAGNAILLADVEPRVKAVVAQFPIADGRLWLREIHDESGWQQLLRRLEENRISRVTTGEERLVDPREDITPPTAERAASRIKSDVDAKMRKLIPLRVAEELLDYRPIDSARRLKCPLLTVCVEHDDVTPAEHAKSLHEAASGRKDLITLRDTTHYASYGRYSNFVAERMTDWFIEHLDTTGRDSSESVAFGYEERTQGSSG